MGRVTDRYDGEAFRFPISVEPVPGLLDEVARLRAQGRYRSALDAVLRVLEHDSRSAGAFQIAVALCSFAGSDADAEPITREQLSDPLLAPVATECVRCAKYWYSNHALWDGPLTIRNPIGLQCQKCRYTLCRACFNPDSACPAPGCHGSLSAPVHPTGRPQGRPAPRHSGSLEFVLILWRGAEPTPEEMKALLDVACAGQDKTGTAITALQNDALDQGLGEAIVYRYEADGRLSPGSLDRMRITHMDHGERGDRLLMIVTAPPRSPAQQAGAAPAGRHRWWHRRPGGPR